MDKAPLEYGQSVAAAAESIEQRVSRIVAEQLRVNVEVVKTTSGFVDVLCPDSLAFVELIMALEIEFAIDIPDEAAVEITTIDEAVTYVEGALKARALRKR
jgi:acyl carrier protein